VSAAGIVVPFLLDFFATPWLLEVDGLFAVGIRRGDAT
jgi:hypothetical protein